jgi:Ring finger domain
MSSFELERQQPQQQRPQRLETPESSGSTNPQKNRRSFEEDWRHKVRADNSGVSQQQNTVIKGVQFHTREHHRLPGLHLIRSVEVSSDEEDRRNNRHPPVNPRQQAPPEEILFLDDYVVEDGAPLIGQPNNRARLFGFEWLVQIIYQWLRFGLAALLLGFLIYMMARNKPRLNGVHYHSDRGHRSQLKEFTIRDFRVVLTSAVLLLIGIPRLSVLFNLFSEKTITQLKCTLILVVVFILGCSEDENLLVGVSFTEREERKNKFAVAMMDFFYGFSTYRSNNTIVFLCNAINSLVLFPNVIVFCILVFMFFLVALILSVICLTNKLELTSFDLELRVRARNQNNTGLTAYEIEKFIHGTCNQIEELENNRKAENPGQANESVTNEVKKNDGEEEVTCPICYCPFEDNCRIIILPPCGHVYHTDCLEHWFKTRSTCPKCRLDMKEYLNHLGQNTRFTGLDCLNHPMLHMSKE